MSMRLSYELYNISYDKLIDYYYVIPYLYKKERKKDGINCRVCDGRKMRIGLSQAGPGWPK